MNSTTETYTNNPFKQMMWWIFFLICVFYAGYAFYMGMIEILSQLRVITDASHRALPMLFILHALAGTVVLICGPLQFNRSLLNNEPKVHHLLGRIYVVTIWITSISGFWNALFFSVNTSAKILFGLLSFLWFSTTTIAFLRIRQHKIAPHREWMIRSFALSLFFVTFSIWVPTLTSTNLPTTISYPLAVFLSWSLNLIAAELWIRHTRN